MIVDDYADWFRRVAAVPEPYGWQRELGANQQCVDRLLRVPTGFGKTAGTVLPWLYRRVVERRGDWPTRLVYCLPMRVLVEQTEHEIRSWLDRAGLAVPVHVLMGGVEQARWVATPEEPQILVGTQDMLLSRALMRGYASGRGLWPMEYGLVHDDALWVVDEVQLMDVGLATTAQLRAFARSFPPPIRPRATWWMSATLQDAWLKTVDHAPLLEAHPLPRTGIAAEHRAGGLWEVSKRLERRPDMSAPDEVARLIVDRHEPGSLTLVIVNTVKRAVEVFRAIDKARRKHAVAEASLNIVHSRFRGAERRAWANEFLRRTASIAPAGRIIVATQIVEAGVDISASLLITDLAPWPSLVQRLGRCARYAGETGMVVVVGTVPPDDAKAAPYEHAALIGGEEALARLAEAAQPDVGPRSLEAAEERWSDREPGFVARLYAYVPLHVLRRVDFLDLFDTSPDLAGADLDVSRYIRTNEEERDARVFFRLLEPDQRAVRALEVVTPPTRDELCPVPVGEIDARKRPAFVRDFVTGRWRRVDRVLPGMVVLLDAGGGGYTASLGWDPTSKAKVPVVPPVPEDASLAAASEAYERDDLSMARTWKTIATHGRETAEAVRVIGTTLGVADRVLDVLMIAARWHDAGKSHPTFQAAISETARTAGPPIATRQDLAKAPAWKHPPYGDRPGFRHELASTLALYEVVRRSEPNHPGLLGAAREALAALGVPSDAPDVADVPVSTLAAELCALSGEELDLVAWLVATHHGKLRMSWTSTPLDQEQGHGGIAGVCTGDELPAFEMSAADGQRSKLPAVRLSLALSEMGLGSRYGASWTERASRLLDRHGPTTLAWLEALLRAADWRASQLATEDPL
ncbi:MAG: type I-G CRISPR-associated helicase/endonuclease Cas3g [Polyangiaceae bacterium]